MTDRELLEWAAKAAGLPECGWMGPAFMYVKDNTFTDWNPLTDDGDALRLAVKLGMEVYVDTHPDGCACTEAFSPTYGIHLRAIVNHADYEPYAATRRAIVRAAAEIGLQKLGTPG